MCRRFMSNKFDNTMITFDTDWAPDWCVRECYEICKSAGAGATFFVTDYLPVLEDIAKDPMFEIGIHPNFFPGSSHGDDEKSVLEYCCRLLDKIGVDTTNGISMRTHGLYQNSRLFMKIISEFPKIRRDVSLFLPLQPCLQPFSFLSPEFIRVPFFWEDDLAAHENFNFSARDVFSGRGGLKIFNFHPIHVALNMRRMDGYERLKLEHNVPDLQPDGIEPYKNRVEKGTMDFLCDIAKIAHGGIISALRP